MLDQFASFPLSLDQRIEYLTLAVSNAKSHPISSGGRQETAIALLTEYEEKLDVARAQLQIFKEVLQEYPNPDQVVRDKLQELSSGLISISKVRTDSTEQ